MGTTSEKLTYLNNTKQLLKDKINNLGGDITDQTTFRQYANQLQGVYDNLPKTEYQEGTEITLSNTLKGKLDFDNGVVGIGQSSQDSTKGYQLFDITKKTSSTGTLINNGFKLVKSNNRVIRFMLNAIYPAGTYTLSMKQVSHISSLTNYFYLNVQKKNGSDYDGVKNGIRINNSTDIEIQIPGEFDTLYFYIDNGETDNAEVTVDDVMFESGTTAHDYEQYTGGQASPNPSYPQEIKCVAGRNKADPSKLNLGKTLSNNGALIDLHNRTTSFQNQVEPNTSYALGVNSGYQIGNLFYYDKNKTYSSSVESAWANSKVITIPNNAYYVSFATARTDNATMTESDVEALHLQIEQGTQATPYLPYNTIEEVVSGKNLFDLGTSTYEKYGITGTYNGSKMEVNGTTTASTNVFDPNAKSIGTFKAGNYVLSSDYTGSVNLNGHAHLMYLRSSNNLSSSDNILTQFSPSVTNSSKQFTLTEDTELFMQWYANSSGIAYDNLEISIQIETGSTATPYEPYITPTSYQLSLGDIELNAIGNYKDELIYDVENDKVYLNKNIGKILLKDIPRGWAKSGYSTDEYFCGFTNFATSIKTNSYYMLCNKLINALYSDTTTSECIANDQESVNLKIKASRLSENSVDGFINYIENEGSDIYILYILKEAVTEEITDTNLHNQVKALYNAHSNNGTTIITSNGNLPMIMKVRGLKGE